MQPWSPSTVFSVTSATRSTFGVAEIAHTDTTHQHRRTLVLPPHRRALPRSHHSRVNVSCRQHTQPRGYHPQRECRRQRFQLSAQQWRDYYSSDECANAIHRLRAQIQRIADGLDWPRSQGTIKRMAASWPRRSFRIDMASALVFARRHSCDAIVIPYLRCSHVAAPKQPARCVRFVDLAPFLVEQLADAALLARDLLQIVQAVEQEITEVGHIRLALHPQMDHARAGEDAEGLLRRFVPPPKWCIRQVQATGGSRAMPGWLRGW